MLSRHRSSRLPTLTSLEVMRALVLRQTTESHRSRSWVQRAYSNDQQGLSGSWLYFFQFGEVWRDYLPSESKFVPDTLMGKVDRPFCQRFQNTDLNC